MQQNNDPVPAIPSKILESKPPRDIVALLSQKVVGQSAAMNAIVPYVYMCQAGLAPEGRPAGIFLLLGPTGTGKTRTVEAIAEILHGSIKNVLKIDCGEFQMEHEVAKLIGSPPGYLGHRETPPMLNQLQLLSVVSDDCDLSIVLFDEIEKAAPSLTRLLLGILDKAVLRLGDNTTVNFERSLIFFTSNLGAREMMKEIKPDFGFQAGLPRNPADLGGRLQSIALASVRKRFSPEFVNRIDCIVTYQPLDTGSLSQILDQHLEELQRHVNTRLGARCFNVEVPADSREFLLRKGTSEEYGARELKRTLHRHITQPLATLVATGHVDPGASLRFDLSEDRESLVLHTMVEDLAQPVTSNPSVLIVDDNRDLLRFLERLLQEAGLTLLTAASVQEAREIFEAQLPDSVLLDYMLGEAEGDDDGVKLGLEFQQQAPKTRVIIMTGGQLSPEEVSICQQRDIPILRKPFLGNDVLSLLRMRPSRISAATGK
jgi:CheY-like chemotaxis protein/energy-coupling factor transporter ATP-binding protein EcfA2